MTEVSSITASDSLVYFSSLSSTQDTPMTMQMRARDPQGRLRRLAGDRALQRLRPVLQWCPQLQPLRPADRRPLRR